MDSVRYSAPHSAMGTIVAVHAGNGDTLWTKTIYTLHFNPDLERDVQDVYIDSLRVEQDLLVIRNEEHAWFTLDPATREVRPR